MEKTIETVLYRHFCRSWRNGVYKYVQESAFDLIKVNDKRELIAYIENKFNSSKIESLPDNSKVYFSKNVTFPRSKFKASYPTCSIVRDKSKADVVIIDRRKIRDDLGMLTVKKVRRLSDGSYVDADLVKGKDMKDAVKSDLGLTVENGKYINILCSYWGRLTSLADFTKVISVPDQAKYIDVNFLNNSNGAIMDDEAFSKIDSMLESRTNDMMNLAIRMLTAYNYEENRFKISQLIYQHWDYVRSWVRKNVEIKAMMNKFNKEYGMIKGRSYYSRIMGDGRFWMTQLEYYKSQEELDIINQKLIESLDIDTNIVEFSVKRKEDAQSAEETGSFLQLRHDFFEEEEDNDE